jgi:hypothetical protein
VLFVGEPGAEIEVDGKRAGKTPDAKLADLSIGKSYSFTAKRAGYKTYSSKFRSEGETEVKVAFSLEKEAPPAPPPERQAMKKAPEPKPAVVKASASASRAAKGKLACSSKPLGAQIWVDGKYTGRDTPAAFGNPVLLPVGSHTIVFKIGSKQSKPQKVNITEGDMAKLINIAVE